MLPRPPAETAGATAGLRAAEPGRLALALRGLGRGGDSGSSFLGGGLESMATLHRAERAQQAAGYAGQGHWMPAGS